MWDFISRNSEHPTILYQPLRRSHSGHGIMYMPNIMVSNRADWSALSAATASWSHLISSPGPRKHLSTFKMSLAGTRLQTKSTEYQKIQGDLAVLVDKRTRLDAQLSENEMVKKEFANLTRNSTVYKLVGSVLVPQDQGEARTNVETRLEFIRGEMKRVDSQIKETEETSEQKKLELVEIQTELQQARSGAASN
ncbi:Prefoldin [Gyrodon lividus]|nr:Prefoldin [Gyrodon lividus]